MRMLINVKFPVAEFNEAVRDGSIGGKIRRILEEVQPENVYFTEQNGQRSAVMVVDLDDASKVPSLCEPWFLTFNATVEPRIAMSPDDLQKSGLENLGKRWT